MTIGMAYVLSPDSASLVVMPFTEVYPSKPFLYFLIVVKSFLDD